MVYLQTTYEICFGEAYFEYFDSCDFSRENTNIDVSVFNTEKYQPARQNMKFVTRSFRSLATKLHILARQADIFGINQFTSK
jgi:hypothetical protein